MSFAAHAACCIDLRATRELTRMPAYYNVLPELDLWIEVKAGNGHVAGAAAAVGAAEPVPLLPVPGSLGVNAANMGLGELLLELGPTLAVSVVLLRPDGPPTQGIHTITLHQRIPLRADGTVPAGADPAFRFNRKVFGPNHVDFGTDAQAHDVVLIELQ
jgi:hypothetical protein